MVEKAREREVLSRLRGLGEANPGTRHWWLQRVTAIVLIPLTIWFIFSLLHLVDADHGEFIVWMLQIGNSILLIVFLAIIFYHAQLGMQVVLEDYVSGHSLQVSLIRGVQFSCFCMSGLSILSILKIVFGS
jgi:succinate dehydrogenase / fumarate reductase membrane anchor subunit